MESLPPPDSFRVDAAHGWLQLGNHVEASAELAKITPRRQSHPDVLKLRWAVYSFAGELEAALDAAQTLIKLRPNDPWGWSYRSFSLRELGRTVEARDSLSQVIDQFPKSAELRVDLARYECSLGHLDQARAWLQKAFALEHTTELELRALNDPDLKPLWQDIDST